jgi:hypothetical protein
VDAAAFMKIVERYVPEGELLERLAEAVHIEYCDEMLGLGHAWAGTPEYLTSHSVLAKYAGRASKLETLTALVDFDQLSEHLREQNRGVARDLPRKLEVLGLVLRQDAPAGIPAIVIDPKDPRVEDLAKSEHNRWCDSKLKTGWKYGDPRDDTKKLHPSMLPWEEISEDEREKDRMMVREIPDIVAAAGMTLARCDDQTR